MIHDLLSIAPIMVHKHDRDYPPQVYDPAIKRDSFRCRPLPTTSKVMDK
jgi:hypothetical protein